MVAELEAPHQALHAARLIGFDFPQQVGDRNHRLPGGGVQHVHHMLFALPFDKLRPGADGQHHERENDDEGDQDPNRHTQVSVNSAPPTPIS